MKAARDLDTNAPKGALDPFRFGVEANRAALERVIDYSLKQQMTTKKVTVDELFDDFHAQARATMRALFGHLLGREGRTRLNQNPGGA